MKTTPGLFMKRTAWGTLLAWFLIFMFHFSVGKNFHVYSGKRGYLAVLALTILVNCIFHGVLWFDRYLDKRIPWFFFPRKRLIVEVAVIFPSTLIFLVFNVGVMNWISEVHRQMMSHAQLIYTYIILMMILVASISVVIARNFFQNWRESLLEMERLKQEKVKSDYQALQNQLNPHFLFNNFNMLLSEIRSNPDNAILITEKLADVYRYVLESKNHETVRLTKELEFAEAIIFLSRVRFGDNLKVEHRLGTNDAEKLAEYRLPPLTLQILIENALKHNIVSSSHPLTITITAAEGDLEVSNNLQRRQTTYSTGLGLNNIRMRYGLLTGDEVTVTKDENTFAVKVPLLKD